MSKYKIFTDSTSDLSGEMVSELDVTVVPTEFNIAGNSYLDYPDAREMSHKEFYRLMRAGEMPKTTVINPDRFTSYFEPALKEGFDILHVVFSTGLTTTMQNSLIAVEELMAKYPERRIVVVDSRAASLGEAALVYYAAQKRDEGASLDEAAAWVENNRDCICHWFTIDDLNHLRRGGRVTVAAAMIGGMLNVKPVMHVSLEGKLEVVEKVRGRRAALEMLLGKFGEKAVDPKNQPIFLVHGDCPDDLDWFAGELKTRFGATNIRANYIGPVIGTHAGPGAFGVCFLGTGK